MLPVEISSFAFNILSIVIVIITIVITFYICGKSSKSEPIPKVIRDEYGIHMETMPTGSRSMPWIVYPKERIATVDRLRKKPISGVSKIVTVVKRPPAHYGTKQKEVVEVRRGGEFIGNRMRFKVKVLNQTKYTITDVTVFLISYPIESLKIGSDHHSAQYPKIEPDGFRSPTFDFLPTQDCVKGEIVAGVSYIDYMGKPHTLNTKPFAIRSVCDLLMPDKITAEDFEQKLKDLECGELLVKVPEWTPNEMYEKSIRILADANFYEVSNEISESDNTTFAKITGFAKGKYTGKEIGVKICITGSTKEAGASCTIQVSGEDQAMILPAIDDLRERLSAWLCPNCSSPLSLENVEKLREGQVVKCSFCDVSIGR